MKIPIAYVALLASFLQAIKTTEYLNWLEKMFGRDRKTSYKKNNCYSATDLGDGLRLHASECATRHAIVVRCGDRLSFWKSIPV